MEKELHEIILNNYQASKEISNNFNKTILNFSNSIFLKIFEELEEFLKKENWVVFLKNEVLEEKSGGEFYAKPKNQIKDNWGIGIEGFNPLRKGNIFFGDKISIGVIGFHGIKDYYTNYLLIENTSRSDAWWNDYILLDNYENLESIKNDLKTLERAVYSGSIEVKTSSNEQSNTELDSNSEDVLTRHLLKLSEVEDQFRQLTNKFEEINFKLDKLSNRLSKIQADNQIRFQDIESALSSGEITTQLSSKPKTDTKKEILPGSSQPQDLGSISYKDTETSETSQQIESVDTTATVVTETFQAEEKILPQDLSQKKQYEFATSFLKVGDYSTAERAFREFVLDNTEHELAGSAQYWYAETFRIRQLYTDAASAYLEGYQKYPKGNKAPINLLKLGVSMVQIGEKDQGCKMINGVELQYPKANQSVIQKAKYESKKFECIKEDS